MSTKLCPRHLSIISPTLILTQIVPHNALKKYSESFVFVTLPWPYRGHSVTIPWPYRDHTVQDSFIHRSTFVYSSSDIPALIVGLSFWPFHSIRPTSFPLWHRFCYLVFWAVLAAFSAVLTCGSYVTVVRYSSITMPFSGGITMPFSVTIQ